MTDGDGMEFRAAAEKLLARPADATGTFLLGHSFLVDLLARAMRIAAEETSKWMEGEELSAKEFGEVAARIESRIGEK